MTSDASFLNSSSIGSQWSGFRAGAFLRPRERFTNSAAFQDDVIRADFREPDAGGSVFAFRHSENLFRVELHYRVSAPPLSSRDDTE